MISEPREKDMTSRIGVLGQGRHKMPDKDFIDHKNQGLLILLIKTSLMSYFGERLLRV
ncbi:hypothetical protein [Bartonella gliris]|uniref:hypothetical protein n=1 Tax=Bartonella gliris TaxID=3004109 RepID=UPI00295EB0C4|nr:hypothetical protein [Bartonella gliris]